MTGQRAQQIDTSFNGRLSEWTSKELQLVRLHEEILSRREALLSCSVAYRHGNEHRNHQGAGNLEQAYFRNEQLLQDYRQTQQSIHEVLMTSPTPRFSTLQKNYWAMVKSQLPMWENDLGIRRPKVRGQGHSTKSGTGQRVNSKESKKSSKQRQQKPQS